MNLGSYAKTLAAIVGSALTVAVTQYPHATWVPFATAAITVIGVFAVPNMPGKSGGSPVLPAADISALVRGLTTAITAMHPGPELPPVSPPPPVGSPIPVLGPDPDGWAGTQSVANHIAAEDSFRSFEDRVFPS